MAKRKTTVRIGIGLAVLALALAVFAWQQGDDGGSGGPLNAIAAAAERTQSEPGGRATMRARVTPPDPSEAFTMTGEIVYYDDVEQGTLEFPNPETGEMVEMELVMEGSMIYMRSDSFGSLPDDNRWIGLDLTLGGELELPVPAGGDATGELEMLQAATGVRKLGKEKVRGVETTRYGGVVSVAEQVADRREEGADRVATWLEENGTPLRIEVWIDAEELVRRIRLVDSKPSEDGEGATTTDMRMDFFDFGSVAKVEVPDGDEVFDATSFAEDEIDSASE